MGEYPEYDFYYCREECDGKGGRGRREEEKKDKTGKQTRQEVKNPSRTEKEMKAVYRGEMTDKLYKATRGEKEKEEVKTRVKL